MIKTLAVSLALTALCAGLPVRAAGDKTPAVGSPAPEFTLDSQEGKPVSLRDFRGKWVVLYFYPKDFTRGCTIEAHNFQRDLKRYEALGVTILGVSMQSSGSHKDFCAKEGLNFKLLADVKGAVSASYGSVINLAVTKLSSRNTFLIDPDGVIAREFLKVSPEGHSEEVLAALTELQKQPPTK
jgi:peroxiredoxin Q/BCP